MLGIDTNVIVRLLVNDDPKQSAQARNLIETERVFVSSTVILETFWVLRGTYGYSNDQLSVTLAAFSGLPNVLLEDPAAVAQALGWLQSGLDFADALHLAKAKECKSFVSFDRKFAKTASSISGIKVHCP